MICHVIFALLALGLVGAQETYRFHTNGTGEMLCGKYHYCIKGAVCLKRGDLKMCECPKDFEGNAKLMCHSPKNNTVVIQSDPHIRTFHKDIASLPSPCRYRLVHLVMKLGDNVTRAVVELFGQNLLFKEGKYFLTNMTISTQIVQGENLMEQVLNLYGDVEKNKFNYTLVAESSQKNPASAQATSFSGYSMEVDKDAVNNLLLVYIPKLGIRLFFRPPSVRYMLDNTVLPFVPGAVFGVEPEYWPFVRINESDFEISSWPKGPSIKEAAKVMGTSPDTFVQYLMLNNSLSNRIYNDEVCENTENIFVNECSNKTLRLRMLDTCASIYNTESFLSCLTNKVPVERYLPLVKDSFQKCEIGFCRKDVSTCLEMRKVINSTGCPLPVIDTFDCNSVKIVV